MHPAILLLDNKTIFNGISLGIKGEVSGEVCFNTSMTGYQEVLTDPSYSGQLVTLTYPHIGNYGINLEDIESKNIQVAGLIIKEDSISFSNYRATDTLNNYLVKENIVGIQEIDTRMLTKIIRTQGAMNGIISSVDLNIDSLKNKLKNVPSMQGFDLAQKVSTNKKYNWTPSNKIDKSKPIYNIAVIDFGVKYNILRLLEKFNCKITVFPANIDEKEILNFNPDGIFLSNGPGDPASMSYAIKTVKKLLGKKPIFGICLGHQILALALGAKTFKLKFGHRGCNHPVKNLITNSVEITSQNHGFAVNSNPLPSDIEITHISLNDNTIEGLRCKHFSAFSVQYHPEASPGPHDSQYLFKEFFNMISEKIYA